MHVVCFNWCWNFVRCLLIFTAYFDDKLCQTTIHTYILYIVTCIITLMMCIHRIDFGFSVSIARWIRPFFEKFTILISFPLIRDFNFIDKIIVHYNIYLTQKKFSRIDKFVFWCVDVLISCVDVLIHCVDVLIYCVDIMCWYVGILCWYNVLICWYTVLICWYNVLMCWYTVLMCWYTVLI